MVIIALINPVYLHMHTSLIVAHKGCKEQTELIVSQAFMTNNNVKQNICQGVYNNFDVTCVSHIH